MTIQRGMRLLALIVLLILVVSAAVWLDRRPTGGDTPPTALLQTSIDEPAFSPLASGTDLLELAERTADELVLNHPDDPWVLSVQARRHYLLSEFDEAAALWRRCLHLDAEFAEAFFGLGLIALDWQKHEEAVARFEDVTRLDSEDPRVPVLLAKSLLLAGRAEDAVLVLEQHVATQQTSADAWEMLGQAHMQRQDYDRAAECYGVAAAAVPSMKEAVYGLWRSHVALGDSEKAETYAEQFRQLDAQARLQKVESAQNFQDRDSAARVAAQTYADAARVYQRDGNSRLAEEFLLRAVLLEPRNVRFLMQLQRSLQERGAYAEAVEIGERIVELEPATLDQWLNLAWLYSQLQQPDRALTACRKAIELSPDDPRCRQVNEIVQRAN